MRNGEGGEGEQVYLAVRPEKMDVNISGHEEYSNLTCTFKEKIYIGSVTKLVLELPNGQEVIVNETAENSTFIEEGRTLQVSWNPIDSVLLTS